MKRHWIPLMIGTLLIAVGLLGGTMTLSAIADVSAHDDGSSPGAESPDGESDDRHSASHDAMHQMMDRMMGEGFTERMHAAMPGSEAMMEACASGMGGMMSDGMMDATE